jgi:hypothetical protein
MKKLLIVLFTFAFAATCFADTEQSRDYGGQKVQGGAYGSMRSANIGTKGFKCFTTLNRVAWNIKVSDSATTDGSGIGFKMFYNGNENVTFPISDSFAQYMNSPVAKLPTITSVCLRGYSTSVIKRATGLFQ